MTARRELLSEAMRASGMSQSRLARISGVRQPSISQMLSGRIDMSDAQLARLLSCLGYQLAVERKLVEPRLTRAELRSWRVHRAIAAELDSSGFEEWLPKIERNLSQRREGVQGEPHVTNVARWSELVDARDLAGIHRALTGLDRESIEMREVAPFAGVISDEARRAALAEAS